MTRNSNNRKNPVFTSMTAIALCFGLSACFDDDDDDFDDPIGAPAPSPSPSPSPTPTSTSFDVSQCLNQEIPGTGGVTVAGAVVPDVLTIDPSQPAGFPNGRTLPDPVIDVTLALLFLDVNASGQSPTTFAELPLNPPSNDRAFRSGFPFLPDPQGSPPIANGGGSSFNFRTAPNTQYVRVDRMGMPAVATALIPSDSKIAYNDAGPVIDARGEFVDEISGVLTDLTQGIGDDLLALNLNICAD